MKFLLAFALYIVPAAAWVPKTTAPSSNSGYDCLPRPHYVELLEQQPTSVVPQSIWPAASALESAMAPLFPAQAFSQDDMIVTAQKSLANLGNGMVQDLQDVNERIATSIVMAINENKVATNQEVYDMLQEGYHTLSMTLARVLQTLEGLSVEQKIAAALATVVLSYPVSYEYYKYENEQEAKAAAKKKADMAEKKKKAAKAKAAAAAAAKAKAKGSKPKKATKGETKTVVAEKKKKATSKAKTPTKEKVVAEIICPETVVTMDVPASSNTVVESVPLVGNANVNRPFVAEDDGGMDAYSRAYAVMLAEATASSSNEQSATHPQPVAPTSIRNKASAISATGSYLDSL